jgi:N-dimethylarginine dimethylaminohydrolase
MVFCANQSLPFPEDAGNRAGVILSRMASQHRRAEVELIGGYFRERGYQVVDLPQKGASEQGESYPAEQSLSFEGMGDGLWHYGRRLLWGGYGPRTDRSVYDFLTTRLNAPVIALQLDDPDFYHLDTCLSILDERTALIYPGAFNEEGRDLLALLFEHVIAAPEDESRGLFACNAHCPDGRHVILQRGCGQTCDALRDAGFLPVEVSTTEYLKSGGSVFCMKLHHW